MTDIGFYHLRTWPLEHALPRLLERALGQGHRILVLAGSDERVRHLDMALWTFSDDSFLPHGRSGDGNAARQPVLLSTAEDNANQATMLVLTDGVGAARLDGWSRVCDMFDGNDETAVAGARERWRAAKAAGHALTYWQQTEAGWEKRAAD